MKSYKITINGNVYNATVEPADAQSMVVPVAAPIVAAPVVVAPAPTPVPVAPAPVAVAAPMPVAPAPTPAPAAPVAAPSATGSGTKVDSPMPGTVLKYLVNIGDAVSHHQVIAILEAMKMENEIVAPVAGKITSIVTPAGSPVNAGDVLVTIE